MAGDPLAIIQESDNDFFENISRTREQAFVEGALSRKNKLLIALALDATRGAVDGVRFLARQALENGATKEEIMETLRVACFTSGVSSTYTAAAALKDVL